MTAFTRRHYGPLAVAIGERMAEVAIQFNALDAESRSEHVGVLLASYMTTFDDMFKADNQRYRERIFHSMVMDAYRSKLKEMRQ
jgi:hypothetical protein